MSMHCVRAGERSIQKQNRRRSGSRPAVIVEQSTEALTPMYRLRRRDDVRGAQELVCETLMIAFRVVRHEVGDRMPKRVLSEEDHSVQTLGFHRAHEAFGERIQIR